MRNLIITILLTTIINSFFGYTQIVSDKKMVDLFAVNFSNGTLPIKKNGKWGLVDSNNIVKVKITYDSIFAGGGGMCIFKKGNQYTFINERFETVYEGKDVKIDVVKHSISKSKIIVTSSSNTELYLSENGVLNKFPNDDSLRLYSTELFTENYFQKTIQDLKLDIDSISKVFENDSFSIIINYHDKYQLKTQCSKKFEFGPPYFIFYTSDDQLNIINLKNRRVSTSNFKILTNSFEIKDSAYYVTSGRNSYEVIEVETGSSYEVKSNVYQFGELIYTTSKHNQTTAEVIHLQTRRILLTNLKSIEKYNGYLVCIDSNNLSIFLNEKGDVFYTEKTDLVKFHRNFINENDLAESMENKLIQIIYSDQSEVLVSTNGKVYDSNGFKKHYKGQFTIGLTRENTYPDKKIGIYDPINDSIYIHNYEDIKFVRNGLWLVKVFSPKESELIWIFIDKEGICKNQDIFTTCDISRFPNSDELIIRATKKDSIVFFDKNLKPLNLNFASKSKLYSVANIYSDWSEGKASFLKIYDPVNKILKGFIDSNLKVYNIKDFSYTYYNPKADYFFIIENNGNFGYVRGNGVKLY